MTSHFKGVEMTCHFKAVEMTTLRGKGKATCGQE